LVSTGEAITAMEGVARQNMPAGYSYETRDELNKRVHDALAAGLPPDQRPVGFPGVA